MASSTKDKKIIESFTPEQEAKFPEYVDKWQKIGLSTERFTEERATEIIHALQEKVLEVPKTKVIITDNPIQAYNLAYAFTEAESLDIDIEKAKMTNQEGFVMPYLDGSYSASIFSFYDFFIRETDIEIDPVLLDKYLAWQATSELGLIYHLENIVIVSQKPEEVHMNELGLHKDGGPALRFKGDCKPLYSLNGVRVPKYLAETPSSQLDMKFFIEEKNADVKMEFVRKFGIERMLEMGKPIDSYKNYDNEWWNKSQYELIDMASIFINIPYAPHLKMVNQTTGVFHVEAVSPSCNNIEEALRERFGGDYEIQQIV